MTLKQFVSVSLHIIELTYRLWKVNSVDSSADSVEHEEEEISREISAAAVSTDESKYDYEDADDSNDESELVSGIQWD